MWREEERKARVGGFCEDRAAVGWGSSCRDSSNSRWVTQTRQCHISRAQLKVRTVNMYNPATGPSLVVSRYPAGKPRVCRCPNKHDGFPESRLRNLKPLRVQPHSLSRL